MTRADLQIPMTGRQARQLDAQRCTKPKPGLSDYFSGEILEMPCGIFPSSCYVRTLYRCCVQCVVPPCRDGHGGSFYVREVVVVCVGESGRDKVLGALEFSQHGGSVRQQ